MILLYTTVEGGHWIPFNTPLSPLELGRVTAIAARGSRDFPAIFHDEDGFDRLYPDGDTPAALSFDLNIRGLALGRN